jgi:putative transposase
MPRIARIAPGGIIYHVLNRGVGRTKLFRRRLDYLAFQRCVVGMAQAESMRVLAYCLMPNHWHLLLWPAHDGDLARFMMRLTNQHVRRWLSAHDQVGSGHLYQGRYKSFAMQDDDHLINVARYVERNAVRAHLAERAELWPWSSVGQGLLQEELRLPLAPWPMKRRADYPDRLNEPQNPAEEAAIQLSIRTGRPYGGERWFKRWIEPLGWREPARPGRRAKALV